jgi:hypothetical protein
MKIHSKFITFIAASAQLLCWGCGKNTSSAPVPLSVEEIPSVVAQSFANSDKETQDQANQFINDVKNHDFSAAFEQIQPLARKTNLTPDQRGVLARALVTTSQKVQDAAAGGDDRANQVLNSYSATK